MSGDAQDGMIRLDGRWIELSEAARRSGAFNGSQMLICRNCGEEFVCHETVRSDLCDVCVQKRKKTGRVLSESEVRDIKEQLRAGASVNALATLYGVNWGTIASIRDRRTWKWVR